MSKSGPILIVEDDTDDKDLFEDIVRELGIQNKIEWFPETKSAFEFLNTTSESVFVIFCDINMPGKNGLEFKHDIDGSPKLRKKGIPFIFLSTQAGQPDVNKAYCEMTVQGFFKKGTRYNDMKAMIKSIFDYWSTSNHPNTNI